MTHFAFVCNKNYEYLMASLFFSPENTSTWYITHGREHHCYTNVIGIDQDIGQYTLDNKLVKKNIIIKISSFIFDFF